MACYSLQIPQLFEIDGIRTCEFMTSIFGHTSFSKSEVKRPAVCNMQQQILVSLKKYVAVIISTFLLRTFPCASSRHCFIRPYHDMSCWSIPAKSENKYDMLIACISALSGVRTCPSTQILLMRGCSRLSNMQALQLTHASSIHHVSSKRNMPPYKTRQSHLRRHEQPLPCHSSFSIPISLSR